jgi:prepilin-type N-terminal cleavage/methylation domain-containing protein
MRRTVGPSDSRTGVTLIELLVVLTIFGLIFGISALALTSLRAPRESAVVRKLREARAAAIRTGMPVRVVLDSSTEPSDRPTVRPSVAFLPDGRALGVGVDPLTGTPLDARH